MEEKICCFCGHRLITDNIEENLKLTLEDLVKNRGITSFYSGHTGEFDLLCEKFVIGLRKKYNLRLSIILPYMLSSVNRNKERLDQIYDEIIIPDLGDVHYKRAIQLRNRWMADRSDVILCYVNRSDGGAYEAMRYAKKTGAEIINIKISE